MTIRDDWPPAGAPAGSGAAVPPRAALMGVDLDLLTEGETITHVLAALDAGHGGWLMNPNVDVLRQLVADPELAALAGAADLVIADGMPLIWALRGQGIDGGERVAGSTLIWSLSAAAAAAGRSVFLLGGAPGVADRAAAALAEGSPGLRIAGTNCPPLGFEHDEAEMARIVDAVGAADPDIVFCGLGFPKQERLIVQLRRAIPRPWFVATGASIAMAAGDFDRAPQWMQDAGLEWAFRLGQEPRRLFRRYIIDDLPFAARLAGSVAGARWRGRGVRSGA
jgi:N-acetylglucosaminyldiphosphoundecaprenol N-acetyl-beta-D-mannosaminyltransferase